MTRTIEICSNNEWLNVYGPLGELGPESCFKDEAGDQWFFEVFARLEQEMGLECRRAQGARTMCHGWNGANTFARKGCGLGTFDDFAEDEWDRAEGIARDVANGVVAHYLAREAEVDGEWRTAAE